MKTSLASRSSISRWSCAARLGQGLGARLTGVAFATSTASLRYRLIFCSSRRRHTRCSRDWSSDVCSSDLAVFTSLGRVEAHPHTYDFRPLAPESNIFLKVPRPLQHRPRDRPVNIHSASFYVLQDTLVGGGLAPNIMMLGQAVDRNHDPHARNLHPGAWNRNHGTGYDHSVHAHLA